MPQGIKFSSSATYLLYFTILFSSSFFAFLADKFAKKDKNNKYIVNKLFWSLSFLTLVIPVSFRGYGVDHTSYIKWYNYIESLGIGYLLNYSGMPEPLYALINFLVANTIGNVQLVFFISALIPLALIYLHFSKYVKKINLAICIWVFGFSYYFFMYGLVRMSIAVGIIIYSYKYLENKKILKYIIGCLIASLFHYSAIIMIPIYFIVNSKIINGLIYTKNNFNAFKYIIIVVISIPLLFIIIAIIFPFVAGGFSWFGRYNKYFRIENNWRTINRLLFAYPLILLIFIWKDYFELYIQNSILYIKLFFIMLGIIVGSIFLPLHRTVFYFYPSVIYLYSAIPKLPFAKHNKNELIVLYSMFMMFFGSLWIYRTFFSLETWKPNLIPYYLNILG